MLSCHTMSISVELPVFKSFPSLSPPHYSSKPVFYNSFFCFGKQNLKCKWRAYVGVTMSKDKSCPSIVCQNDSEKFVEVIGIGSKKDSLLDLCLESPFNSSSLRFWNIFMNDSANVQLHQRFLGKDLTPRLVEVSSFLQTCSKAIILLASAGYGEDDTAAINILKTMKAVDGFAIAIILKPFSFEGQRRLDEVKVLEEKLQDHINFCINIDTDRLLEKDLVTLDEALRTANNAVLLAVNAILVLLSDIHRKLIDVLHNDVKELRVSEILHILGSYREAKIGFGAGSNIKTSILQAIYDCPFIGAGVKEVSGMVICIVASSNTFDNDDLRGFLRTFRQTTEYMGEIIVSSVGEPNLESNLLVTTVITLGSLEQKTSQNTSILSRLAHHFPFVFNLLKRHDQQSSDTQGKNAIEDACLSEVTGSPDSGEMENNLTVEAGAKGVYNYSGEVQTVSSNYDNIYASSKSGRSEAELYEPRTEPSNFDDQISEGTHSFQREPLNSWNLGPGYQIAQQWAKERAADSRARTTIDNLSIFYLPVGVRAPEELKDGISSSHSQQQDSKTEDDDKALPLSSLSALTGASFEAVRDFYSNASTLLKGKTADAYKKQGLLSTRAASMLEIHIVLLG
ncbi:Protein ACCUMULATION AND REPLICATION OF CHLOROPLASTS 3 [Melia azedarach]|uniref:Protein ACCUMULATION AND REPLICATION OF CHLOROPLASTS 3 n=1 Tax=Melia azedarach TaxID=155640 RepID=A0ACC1XGY0_MELAZ|nr:Protein ACCUMULATION AND REPLICATION OF CHLOROPLASTS 3 [Melia azedarach]